ncbi:MAG: cobalt-precorrin-5B (C(1))-methyltransferase CbiD [Proteobacteria bacterium]|nr:cobalt-precorrin-5B (C(1))-methyltransferase CbiD [Pseudomonadota bacterium]
MAKRKRQLRTGFTTGTAAAAASKGALYLLLEEKAPPRVKIALLTGDHLVIPIHTCIFEDKNRQNARCTVIKDAGDDPDVTHRAEIGARVMLLDEKTEWSENDPDNTGVIITGGQGVGTVTKPGLEILPGEPAINPGPRKMITRAVQETLKAFNVNQKVKVQIFVPQGEVLAHKTLNPRLGILGGISILGTTGIEKPMSHEAYIATVKSSLSVARAVGITKLVLTTGRRSERYAQALWPGLPQESFIQIGDFFRMSLVEAAKIKFASTTLAVFFGKALKMAQGIPHTHAAKSSLTMHKLAEWSLALTGNSAFSEKVLSANTARHAFEFILDEHPEIITHVGEHMLKSAKLFSGPGVKIHGIIFDYNGNVVFDAEAPSAKDD